MSILKTTVNIFRLLRLLVRQTPTSVLPLGKTFTRACGVQILIKSDSVFKRVEDYSKQPNIVLDITSLKKASLNSHDILTSTHYLPLILSYMRMQLLCHT